jgi:hypothetical protein
MRAERAVPPLGFSVLSDGFGTADVELRSAESSAPPPPIEPTESVFHLVRGWSMACACQRALDIDG